MVVGEMVEEVDLIVIGAGPGGYTAALKARELGQKVMLVDRRKLPGGVCLHEGCIPSKSLLHCSQLIFQAQDASCIGLTFTAPNIDLNKIRSHKSNVINKLTQGLNSLFKSHKLEFIDGRASFIDERNVRIDRDGESAIRVKFKNAIIATGSSPTPLPQNIKLININDPSKVMNSSTALDLNDIPQSLLVIGGGYIGLELGQVYASLGTKVDIVEFMDSLLPGLDSDLVRPLANKMKQICNQIMLSSKVTQIEEKNNHLAVTIVNPDNSQFVNNYEKVLVSIGRVPNTDNLGLNNLNLNLDKGGFIPVNEYCQTQLKRIYAIGDVVANQPMLAHKAMRQGHVVAERLSGIESAFDNRAIPAVVYTDPEIAWCGLTENEANKANLSFTIAKLPWVASGRAQSIASTQGLTKILYDKDTKVIIGACIVGVNAGELIAQMVIAMEMGACIEDIANSIYPHPTLSETIMESALIAYGKELSEITQVNKAKLIKKL